MDDHRYWLNRVEYPFALREFDSGEGWMNYIDEGQGRPVLFVHGNMTWSFLFRRTIEALSEGHRCIAVDHLGYGLSDKPQDANYWPEAHAARFAAFVDQLGLRDLTLVVHDAGVPIALDWAADNPDRVRDIVIFNGHLWNLRKNEYAMKLSAMMMNPINRLYYRMIQSAPGFVLPAAFADRHRMNRSIERQYLKPFGSNDDRKSVYTMIESWKKSGDWYDSVGQKMNALCAKRTLLLWGMKDPMFGAEALTHMQELFPAASTLEFEDSGKFLPEEQSERIAGEIRWFLMNSGNPSLALIQQLGG